MTVDELLFGIGPSGRPAEASPERDLYYARIRADQRRTLKNVRRSCARVRRFLLRAIRAQRARS